MRLAKIWTRLKQRIAFPLRYRRGRRYLRLLSEVERRAPLSIVEVGVYEGVRAREMIELAALSHDVGQIRYFGFDLFDLFTPDVLESELSKTPLSRAKVARRLARSGAEVKLYQGWSQETLPRFVEEQAGAALDFVFIDGGHAIETIRGDWQNLERLTSKDTVVIFDDYYVDCPWLTHRFGCNRVLDELDPNVFRYEVITLPDVFKRPEGDLRVALARVWRR
jgi:Methyltransferase domain